jgi:NACHT domain
MLFSEKSLRSLPTLWPILEAILDHPFWTLLTFLGLLLLTGLFWLGSRGRSPTPQRALSEHDRVYMLKRLRFQYKQMLAQSLQGVVQIELGLASRSAAVQNVASLSLRLPDQPEQLLPPSTSIVQAYELAQQELLILGEPGAGKSTQLLELAHHLVEQAKHDAAQPLPIVLPLSSWATTHPPLHDWLVEQVALLYHVPKGLSLQWLQGEQLLPLLDGLDEMETSQRAVCITAINTYHHEHLQSLVVCSRTSEYEAAATQEQLALHSAVVVQPLSAEQVDTHLEHLGQPLVALRTIVRKNPILQELATTPLMVQVLVLTYHGVSIQALSQKEAQLREQIWTDYVGRMVSHKGNGKRYPLKQTLAWMSFLAQQMRGHNQTIFFLERLQPDWLPKKPRAVYRWSTGLLIGLTFGLVSEIKPVEALTWSRSRQIVGLLGGLAFGLLFGLGAASLQPHLFLGKREREGQYPPVFPLLHIGLEIGSDLL